MQLDARHLSSALHRLKELGQPLTDSSDLQYLVRRATEKKMNAWSTANIADALPYLKDNVPTLNLTRLTESVRKRSHELIEEFTDQGLCNVAWSLTKLCVVDPDLMAKVSQEFLKCPEKYTPEGLSILAWSFARQGLDQEEVYDALLDQSAKKLANFNSLDMNHLSWCLLIRRVDAPPLMESLCKARETCTEVGNSGDVVFSWAMVMLSSARMGTLTPEFAATVARALLDTGDRLQRSSAWSTAAMLRALEMSKVVQADLQRVLDKRKQSFGISNADVECEDLYDPLAWTERFEQGT